MFHINANFQPGKIDQLGKFMSISEGQSRRIQVRKSRLNHGNRVQGETVIEAKLL